MKLLVRQSVFFIVLIIAAQTILGQSNISVYPTHWWVGMKNPKLQLLIYGESIGSSKKVSLRHAGIKLERVHRFPNPNYLALDLLIASNARPGNVTISLEGAQTTTLTYELKERRKGKGAAFAQGISAADFIYLIMPDRFANGDPSNDAFTAMRDTVCDRNQSARRHGGDLQGVAQKLDYLQDLGVTSIWLNPILENDMPPLLESGRYNAGFHGYWHTDHYQVDKRLGGNAAYQTLIDAMHNRGMKMIQDVVYNHVGEYHLLYQQIPDSSWFNFWPGKQVNTSYKDQTLMDPYAAAMDKKIMTEGWFTPHLPDLNQRNPFVANFLIQNTIWWTEAFGIDGWRIDTYAYNDLSFMNRCNQALLDEYPNIGLFGETWVHGIPNQAFFTANKLKGIAYESNLPGVTDFQLNLYGIFAALNQPFGWTEGVNRLYLTLSNDYVYKDPMKHVIFLDNHDVSRFYSLVNKDLRKYKAGIAWLLTCRGIPQLYYGTEILMDGYSNPDDLVRKDFQGGWKTDKENKFSSAGRTRDEEEAFTYLRTIAQFRKNASAIRNGKMMQFVPQDGVYVYFRYNDQQTIMCIMNTNNDVKTISLERFQERTKGFRSAYDVAEGKLFELGNQLQLKPMTTQVLELRN